MLLLTWCLFFALVDSFQTVFFTNGPFATFGHPDICLALIILVGLTRDPKQSALLTLAAGISREFFVSGTAGPHLILFLFIGLLAQSLRDKMFRESTITLACIAFILGLIANALSIAIDHGGIKGMPLLAWQLIFMNSVLTGLIMAPLYRLLESGKRKRSIA